jgi:hypothetical protein
MAAATVEIFDFVQGFKVLHKKTVHLIQVPPPCDDRKLWKAEPWRLGAFTRIFFRAAMKSFTLL